MHIRSLPIPGHRRSPTAHRDDPRACMVVDFATRLETLGCVHHRTSKGRGTEVTDIAPVNPNPPNPGVVKGDDLEFHLLPIDTWWVIWQWVAIPYPVAWVVKKLLQPGYTLG